MTTKIVSRLDKSGLVAGLTWQPLIAPLKKRSSEIRNFLSESDAKKIALITSDSVTMLGMYSEEEGADDEGVKPPSKLYSLALAFAGFIGNGNAVLTYQIKDSPLCSVVLIEMGRPVLDDVKITEDIQTLAASYANGDTGFAYDLYTNDLGNFPSATLVEDEKLWSHADKSSLLINKPINLQALLTFLLVVGLLVGAGFGYNTYDKAAKRRELIRLDKLNNPVVKYEAALIPRLLTLGLDSKSAIGVLDFLQAQPVLSAGWALKSIVCSASSSQCISNWLRKGGTTNDLIAARKPFNEVIMGESTLNESMFSIKVPMKESGVSSRIDIPEEAASVATGTPVYQTLANAGVEIKVPAEGFKTWPDVSGLNMKEIPRTSSIRARKVEISTTMPLALEVLRSLPNNFWWTDIQIEVGSTTSNPIDLLTVSLKGNNYVR